MKQNRPLPQKSYIQPHASMQAVS